MKRGLLALAFVSFCLPSFATTLRLTPDEVIRLTLENNGDIQLALLDFRIAEAEAEASEVDFDTHLTVIPSYKQDTVLPNSTLDAESYRDTTGGVSLGLKRKFGLGTQTELAVQELRLTTKSNVAVAPERYQGATQFKLTQPLLKGGWRPFNEATYRKAQFKRNRYYWNLHETIDKQLVKTLALYWDLRSVEADISIKKDSLALFTEKLELANRKLKLGQGSGLAVLQARADYELKLAEMILLRAKRDDVEEKLLREIVSLETETREIRAEASKENLPELESAPPIERETAFARNSLLQKTLFAQKEAEVDLRKAENSALPQLDLAIQMTSTGIGNTRSQAEVDMTAGRFLGWAVSLNFLIPLEGRTSRGALGRERMAYHMKELATSKEQMTLVSKLSRHDEAIRVLREKLSNLRSRVQRQKEILNYKEAAFAAGRIGYLELKKEIEKYEMLRFQEEDALGDLSKETVASQADEGTLAIAQKQIFLDKAKVSGVIGNL